MVSKMCPIASMIVLATFVFSSAASAAICSNASLSGIYLWVSARRHRHQRHPYHKREPDQV
jgi:hypothetical protein